ncbi:hypothetical protein B0H10DRAFT_1967750 [Mycena sp. CBHHK59/15]|nr:hypothetical protein B0H10DRAFT_1967750 [Mycena sp. CBHHK59/15]
MPKQARQARHAHRGPAGGFASNQPLPETVEAASDAERSDDVLAWESDEESDAGEDDSEQWEQQPARPYSRARRRTVRKETPATGARPVGPRRSRPKGEEVVINVQARAAPSASIDGMRHGHAQGGWIRSV